MSQISVITSKDNSTIKSISLMQKSSKKRREEGVFILEGIRLCLDAIQNGFTPFSVFLSTSFLLKNPDAQEVFKQANEIFEVRDSVFEKISDTVSPQGVLCVFEAPIFDQTKIKNDGKYIALENVQDPSNLGAISRTAEAFGIDGLIVQGGCDPFSSKSLRASMGALLRIPVIETKDMFSIFEEHNLTSYASVVSQTHNSINDVSFNKGSVVIIGNEANGISQDTINKSNYKFTIPMSGKAESLNAAVAASIIIWEMCK